MFDPWASKEEVKYEYNLDLIVSSPKLKTNYDAIILAVSHKQFLELDITALKSDIGVIFDVKSLLPKQIVDARL